MKISADDVKKLRDLTGAGMMDCKKALTEAEGNIEKAIELLRKKGQKILGKRADRVANEGAVIALATQDGKRGVSVNISAETDFVAMNSDFVAMAEKIAALALEHFPATIEELNALAYEGNLTVGDKTVEQAGVIGEKIEVAKYQRIEGEQVVAYIHGKNRLGVLVELNQNSPAARDAGKNVAMQIAAMFPIAVDKDDVPADVLAKELEIAIEVTRNENPDKPTQMIENIAKGKVNKLFFKDKTLLNQAFVKDTKSDVRTYLATVDKKLTVKSFVRMNLG